MAKESEQLAEAVLNHALEIICLLTVEDFIVVKRPSDGNRCTFSIHATEITSNDYHSGGPQLLFTLQGVEEKTQKMVALLANKIVSLMSRKVLTECEGAAVYSNSYKDKYNDLKGHDKPNKKEPAICTIEPPPAPVQRSAEKSYPMKFSIKEEPCEQPLHTTGGISALPSPSLIPGALEPDPHLPPVNVYVPFMAPQPSPGLILLSPCDLKPTTDGGSSANTFTSLGAQKLRATVHRSSEKSHPTKHFIKEEPDEEPHRSTDETLAFPPPKFVLESPKSKPPLPAVELHIPAQTAPESGIIYAHEIKYDPDEDSETTIDSMDTDTPQSPSSDQEDEYTIIYQIKEDQEESKDSSTSSFEDNFSPADVTNTDEEYVPPEPTRKKSRKSRSEMPPPCEVCGKVLCSKSTLEKHLQIHTGDRPFICTECGQRFSCKNHLTTHERSHTGERPFVCNVCGRKFFKQQHLVLHKVTHTGEKPYTCPVCGKGFTRQSSVVKHSGMHAEQKPFVCNVCGKSYCQYASLVVHQRIHSGEKPFVCQVCEKAFTCKATMLKHEKSHMLKSPLPHMPPF